jgi:hypothetical protein
VIGYHTVQPMCSHDKHKICSTDVNFASKTTIAVDDHKSLLTMEVSAMLVLTTILRMPLGGVLNTRD